MKNTTQLKLNVIASDLASAFVQDVAVGHTTSSVCEADRARLGCSSDLDFVKATIRMESDVIDSALNAKGIACSMSNIVKTPYQLNYLANEVLHRIRMRAQRCPFARRAVKAAFATKSR